MATKTGSRSKAGSRRRSSSSSGGSRKPRAVGSRSTRTPSKAGSAASTRRPASRAKQTAQRATGRAKQTAQRATGRAKSAARTATMRASNGRRASSNGRSSSGSGRQKDVIALLKEDHREVEQMFRKYSRLGDRAGRSKRSVVRDIVKELSKHAATEEQILYPTLNQAVRGGKRMQDEGIQEHQEVKELLAALDKMSPSDEEFDSKMQRLMESVRHHVREEESEMFPKLRSSVDRKRLVQMGQLAEMAKKAAPTRPHPRAPSKPPANVVVGAVSGIADRVRDIGREVLSRDG